MPQTFRFSVKELVAFSNRSGDLYPPTNGKTVSAEEGHQGQAAAQKTIPANYQREYRLASTVRWLGDTPITLHISGRADGVVEAQPDKPPLIEEIKTVRDYNPQVPHPDEALHMAQLLCYGYLYCLEHKLAGCQLRLCYYDISTQNRHHLDFEKSFAELQLWFYESLTTYCTWLELIVRHRKSLARGAEKLAFPFATFRGQQRNISVAVFRCLRDGTQLLCEAPTGSGKTMATLFPVIKHMANDENLRCFYATAKNSGKRGAVNTAAKLSQQLKLKTLVLTAREQACPCEQNQQCNRQKDYYGRNKAAMKDAFDQTGPLDYQALQDLAEKHQICPWQLANDLAPWVDLVIGDFNYVFSRSASSVFTGAAHSQWSLLFDEAHNLPSRARTMYSATLDSRQLAAPLTGASPRLRSALKKLLSALNRQSSLPAHCRSAKNNQHFTSLQAPNNLANALESSLSVLVENESNQDDLFSEHNNKELLFSLNHFAEVLASYDDSYRCELVCNKRGKVRRLKLLNINPAAKLAERMANFQSVVGFSATLSPMPFYVDALGLAEDCQQLTIPSPFESGQMAVLNAPFIDTRYQKRQQSLTTLCELIALSCRSRQGNYLAYFPSYQYLELVHETLSAHQPALNILAQKPNMSERERQDFLAAFQTQHDDGLLGLAVMGGIFGEGIDLVGESLVGVIIAGPGLAPPEPEAEEIRLFQQARGYDGQAAAYTYPALQRVLQTAGRLIRSERDRGILLLIDPRFSKPPWRQLLPSHWQVQTTANLAEVSTCLNAFWQQSSNVKEPASHNESTLPG